MKRILVIRGGAIGDFILTLPALKALRGAFPAACIEVLGYKHIAALAEKRFYADAVRSIEYAALSGFFARNGELNQELRDYFGSFELVISYLFDPDGIFEANLLRSGVAKIVSGPAKIRNGLHAARQLAAPIEQLGVTVNDYSAKIFPAPEDLQMAQTFLTDMTAPIIALHVGSGSGRKNWPVENWIRLGEALQAGTGGTLRGCSLLVVSGEADEAQLAMFQRRFRNNRTRFATNLPLPQLGATLAQCAFIGHDSGISHLAAAAGANCLILFGPTDPAVWAPQGSNVHVLRSPTHRLDDIDVAAVSEMAARLLL